MEKRKVNRLKLNQTYELIKHFEEHQGSYRGMTPVEICSQLRNHFDYDVTPNQLLHIQKETGLQICPKTRKATKVDEQRAIVDFLCYIAHQLSIEIPKEIQSLQSDG